MYSENLTIDSIKNLSKSMKELPNSKESNIESDSELELHEKKEIYQLKKRVSLFTHQNKKAIKDKAVAKKKVIQQQITLILLILTAFWFYFLINLIFS